MKRLLFSAVALSFLTINAAGEAIERPWKDKKGSTSAHNRTIFGKKIITEPAQEKPRIYIRKFNTTTAPKPVTSTARGKTAKKVVGSQPVEIIPAKVRTRKAKRPSQTLRRSKLASKRKGNGQWWEKTGNPAVFAFRDCSASFAAAQTKQGKQDTPANYITSSMKTACQLEFAKMAGVLIGGLGEEKSNEILKELAQSTFLPSVKLAVKQSLPQPAQVAVQPSIATPLQNKKALITLTKKQMFDCFIERTDRLSAAKSTQANTIASAVIAGCQRQSDMFFDNLFANSKANPQVIAQQKSIALNEVYRQAIVKRVLVTRGKAKLQTATGSNTQTTTVIPVQ